jgi:hypothetical protein
MGDFFLCFFSFTFIIKIQEKKRDRLIYICLKRERERKGTCSNDHMKINIEQNEIYGNNEDENETKLSFLLGAMHRGE